MNQSSEVASGARESDPLPRRQSQKGMWIFSGISLGLFAILSALVVQHDEPYFEWDLAVSRSIQAVSWPGMDGLMRAISLAGDNVVVAGTICAFACLVLLTLRAWREAVVLGGAIVLGQLLKIAFKHLIGRPRPTKDLVEVVIEAKEVHSFPSGHTVHYVVFFGFLWYLTYVLVQKPVLRWPLLLLFGAMVVLVGISRIFLGAHWASDIVGGYLVGGAVLAISIVGYRRWTARDLCSPIVSSRG